MLSLFNSSKSLTTFSNTKCAEVFCQNIESFSIICTFCELKTFDFEDFTRHFKNVHLDNRDSTTFKTIKCEMLDDDDFQGNVQDIDQLTNVPGSELQLHGELEKDDIGNYDNDCDSQSDTEDADGSKDEDYVPMILKTTAKKDVHSAKHICKGCGKSYKLVKTLERHVERAHNGDKQFKCQWCECAFTSAGALSSHQQKVHAEFPCSQCDKTYKTKRALDHHFFSHGDVRNFICDFENCGKSFFSPKNLSSHKRIVHELERNYVCETCGFRTKSKPALVVHNRSHTGEKPFVCNVCDRRFASQSLLGEHRAMHLTNRPHKCEVCGATFARAKALYHHKHLHLGIKKFLCKICGKAYAQAAGLSGHMRQHKSEQF